MVFEGWMSWRSMAKTSVVKLIGNRSPPPPLSVGSKIMVRVPTALSGVVVVSKWVRMTWVSGTPDPSAIPVVPCSIRQNAMTWPRPPQAELVERSNADVNA